MAKALDGQALSCLFPLAVLVVQDDDSRLNGVADGNAVSDGSHVYIRARDWRLFHRHYEERRAAANAHVNSIS